ncbi:cache domain-containing sensor histidine kinase [Cohnella soli]|uniref:Sensor histidine kinase n=1 Tax=Cohnella soli TaxID=425005 RepID=A0ABW0HVF6_9BACL
MKRILNRIRKSYRNLLLRQKITLIFSLMAIALLIVQGTVIYRISVGVIRNEMESGAKQAIEQTSLNIDSYFEEIKTIIQLTANNRTLIDSVENYFSGFVDQLEYNQNLQNILVQYTYMIPYVDNILVIKDGRAIYDKNSSTRKDYDFNKQTWFTNNISRLIKASFVGPHHNDYYYDPSNTRVISVIIPVRDSLKTNSRNAGEIMIDIDIKKITSIFGKIGLDSSQDISIIDRAGTIIANRDNQLIGTSYNQDDLAEMKANDKGTFTISEGNTPSLVVYSTSPVTGWKTVITTKMTKIGQVAGSVRFTTVLIIFTAVLLAMATSLFISSKITRGIIKLKEKMDLVGRGNDLVIVEVENNDEVGMLSRHFNRMVVELKQLINENYLVKIKQKEAELSALQAKINPHFLNNTLQSLHAMAVLNKTKDIETTIESLGKLFDYVLYESGDIVRVEDEMNYLESFLQIQQSRNTKRFEYSIDADPQARNIQLPKLLIQPLVENALIHGLKSKFAGGFVSVSVCLEEGNVVIRVSDNGEGMSSEQLERVHRLLNDEDLHAKSIGLKNVKDRLKLTYGEDTSFLIETKLSEGTSVWVKLPITAEY